MALEVLELLLELLGLYRLLMEESLPVKFNATQFNAIQSNSIVEEAVVEEAVVEEAVVEEQVSGPP